MERVFFALELELDAGPGPSSMVLICPLDREGNTPHAYVIRKPRMIDVRPGDTVQHADGRWKVLGIKTCETCTFPTGSRRRRIGHVMPVPYQGDASTSGSESFPRVLRLS
jgi:hypothetical protein